MDLKAKNVTVSPNVGRRFKPKHHPGDANESARQRAEHRTRPPTDEYRKNFGQIKFPKRSCSNAINTGRRNMADVFGD